MQIDTAYSTGIQYSQQKAAETTASKALHAAADKKLKEACKGFEAMFMNMMYKEMRKSVPKNELFGNSNADEIMQDMLDTEMVDRMADAGGFGLADIMYKQLKLDEQARADMDARNKAKIEARNDRLGI